MFRLAYALKFHTWTTLAKVSEKASERKPPPALYFYERVHRTAHISLDPTVEWPWGFWSTLPNDACGRKDIDPDQTHRPQASRHSITYMGCSADGRHTWVQFLGDWMFYIETQYAEGYHCRFVLSLTCFARQGGSPVLQAHAGRVPCPPRDATMR